MKKRVPTATERALNDVASILKKYSGTKRENILASWFSQYTKYLKQEETFKPQFLKRYLRGEIIKVDLGYKLGCEEGGPHYAIVLDKNNSLYSGVITILPLTSKKPTTRPNKYTVDLGDEIYRSLKRKAEIAFSKSIVDIKMTPEVLKPGEKFELNVKYNPTIVQPILNEINSMKEGSIAIVSQITTVSKMRIIKPKRTTEPLSGIRISNDSLTKIDKKIVELYIGKSYEE